MDLFDYTVKTSDQIFNELKTSEKGLSTKQARGLLEKNGSNSIHSKENKMWDIFVRQFKSPFVYLLFIAGLIALVLGQKIDTILIAVFVLVNTVLGFYQEYKSENTLKILKKYLVAKAVVVREGNEKLINASELVNGDLIILNPGDIIPADVRFVDSYNLSIDESVLTGESVPIQKDHNPLKSRAGQISEALNLGYSGTSIMSGEAKAVVVAIGKNTNYGHIASLTAQTVRESTYEKELSRFSKFTLVLVSVTLAIVVAAHLILKSTPSFAELALFAIALAVSVIPEALPVVTTFSLSLGALHLAKNNVVVKRLSAIEDLGGIQILCTDKTGTLTENKLEVDNVFGRFKDRILIYANLASVYSDGERRHISSAFEDALINKLTKKVQKGLKKYEVKLEIPFDPERKRSSVIVEKDSRVRLIVRGAPENILPFCQLSEVLKSEISDWITTKGRQGIRVLAVASRSVDKKDKYDISKIEENVDFIGLVSFIDPIKTTAKESIELAEVLGVKVKILTGDSREVAGSVAQQVGLVKNINDVITGDAFDALQYREQQEAAEKYSVFARVTPAQKYKIIQILQEKFEVGFLGEGINDAPALKVANVALAVKGASDIANDASDIILLKKSLKVIVDGIKEGRSVFANTNKYIMSTLTSNFGNFFAMSAITLLIDFLPMLPLQILLVNLLSDFPMIAVATDNIDLESVRTPHKYNLKSFALIALLLGMVSTIFDFIFFGAFFRFSPSVLQTSWFIGSILTELLFIFSIRTKFFFLKSSPPSKILLGLALFAGLCTILIPFTSIGQHVFGFTKPSFSNLAIILGIAGVYLAVSETIKLVYFRAYSR